MPTYDITFPDGRKFRVTAPDGATHDEVIAYAKKNIPAAPAPSAGVEDPGALGAAIIGAGRGTDKLAAGLRQLTRNVFGDKAVSAVEGVGRVLGMADGSQLEAQQAGADDVYAKLAEKRPVATTIGELAPAAAMTATAAGPAAMIAASSLPGLMEYGTTEERLTRGAMGAAGGAAGAALGKVAGRILQPTRQTASRVSSDAIGAAERLGYKPTAGQVSGSRALQILEQQTAKNPVGSFVGQKFNAGNQTAINRAAARAMGESADLIDESVMGNAATRLGAGFDAAFAGKDIPINNSFKAFANSLNKSAGMAGEFADAEVKNLAGRVAAVAERGSISGEEYQAMRSALNTIKRQAAASSNGSLKYAATGTIKALDDAAADVVPAAEMEAFKRLNAQYAAMKTLHKTGTVKGGNVDPAVVRSALQSADKSAFARGGIPGELADIARIGNAFRPLPDSGTAANTVTQVLLSGGAGLMGPEALAASLIAPAAIGKGLFSDAGRKYLTSGLLNVSPELERLLVAAGATPGGLLGLQASR